MNIYLLDEDQETMKVITGLLKEIGRGDFLKKFASGSALLADYEQDLPEIIFIRLGETPFNGLDIANAITTAGIKTAIIFISKHPSYASLAWQAGAAGFLIEPLDSCHFYLLLNKYLKQESLQGFS